MDEVVSAVMAENDRLRIENAALRKELNLHVVMEQIEALEQELAKLKATLFQQAIVKGYGG